MELVPFLIPCKLKKLTNNYLRSKFCLRNYYLSLGSYQVDLRKTADQIWSPIFATMLPCPKCNACFPIWFHMHPHTSTSMNMPWITNEFVNSNWWISVESYANYFLDIKVPNIFLWYISSARTILTDNHWSLGRKFGHHSTWLREAHAIRLRGWRSRVDSKPI